MSKKLAKNSMIDVLIYIDLLMESKKSVYTLSKFFENEYDFLENYQEDHIAFLGEYEMAQQLLFDMEDTLLSDKSIVLQLQEIQAFATRVNAIFKYVKNLGNNEY